MTQSHRLTTAAVTTDTIRELVVVTLCDTVWERTTLTLQLSETGDTLQRSIVTDRLTVRDRKLDRQITEHKDSTRDSVAVETSDKTVAVVSPNQEVVMDKDGNLNIKKPRITALLQILKWAVALMAAVIAIILTVKHYH